MAWKHPPSKISLPCNGDLVRFLRKERGWTQKRLCAESGYSERLISKIEAGQPVHPDTIEIIAEALSSGGATVNPEDLCIDPIATVRPVAEGYMTHGRQLLHATQDAFQEDVVADIANGSSDVALGGKWIGLDGLDQYSQVIADSFQILAMDTRYRVIGSDVVAYGTHLIRADDDSPPSEFWSFSHYELQRGKIQKWTFDFDAERLAKLIEDGRRRVSREAADD